MAYMNKGVVLEAQRDFEAAIACYEKSVSNRMLCVDDLNMYWIVPDLLKGLRYRAMTLFAMERWRAAASNIEEYLSRFAAYLANDSVDDSLKKSAQGEVAELISLVRDLTPEQRGLLYAELGDDSEALKLLIDGEG